MLSAECSQCKKLFKNKKRKCPYCGAPNQNHKSNKPKKWFQKTSYSLCIGAIIIIIGFGFIHIITGVRTRYGLPYAIALKESFGYRETFVNAKKITSVPYVTAEIKYPIGCKVLQKLGYIDSGNVFETAMSNVLYVNLKRWQDEFEKTLNKPDQRWKDRLLGETETARQSSRTPEYYNNRGITAAKQSEYERAISEFTRAISRNPTFADAYYNRGLVYVSFGQVEKAVSDFTKVIEITPEFTEGYINRGNIYTSREEYEQAISDFTKVIDINPKHAEAYFGRLLVYFALGQYDKTWDDIQKIEDAGYQIPNEFLMILQKLSDG